MAQSERTAKGLTWTSSELQSLRIAFLRIKINQGNTIFADDINTLATLINNMNGHYHTYDDAWQLATFGNTGDRGNYYEDKNTAGPDQILAAPTDTAANSSITATRHNELANAINTLRSHYHEIDDRTG